MVTVGVITGHCCFCCFDHGLVQRTDIMTIYEESGSDQGAADNTISRWLKAGRIVRKEGGVYELGNG